MTRTLLFWFGIVTLAAAVLYIVLVPRWSVNDVRKTIARDLPLGSSKSTVTAWLQTQPHVTYFSDVAEAQTLKFVGIGARIPNSGAALWRSSEEIDIMFHFEADKLIQVEVIKRQISL